MSKTITDFIRYADHNMTWFALNIVLIFMPIACMSFLNKKAQGLDRPGSDMSYSILLICVCIANCIQFALRPRIYKHEKRTAIASAKEEESELVKTKSEEPEPPKKTGGLGSLLAGLKKA